MKVYMEGIWEDIQQTGLKVVNILLQRYLK